MSLSFVKRHDVRRTEDYWCEIDEYENAGGEKFLLAHISVTRWSPSVCKQLVREFRAFRTYITAPLFACPKVADAKWVKFVSLLGFRFQEDIICGDGASRPLFIHTT